MFSNGRVEGEDAAPGLRKVIGAKARKKRSARSSSWQARLILVALQSFIAGARGPPRGRFFWSCTAGNG